MSVSESEVNTGREAGSVLRAFQPGLRFKLSALVASISLVGVLISTFVLLNFQRQQIIQNAESTTTAISNTIKTNLRHAMLSVDRNMTDEIIRALVSGGTVETVRILDARGVVRASSFPSEVGSSYNRAQPGCQFCHSSQSPATTKTAIFAVSSDRQVLFNVDVFQNDAECQGCHADDNQVLGLLVIETPLDSVQEQLNAGYWRTGFLSVGTFLLLVGVLVPTLRWQIIEPIKKLEKGVAEISGGNLDGQIQVTNRDELGRLAQSFNTMREQLRTSRAEMEDRNQELSVLNEVALTVSQSLDLQEVLDRALETVTDKLRMEASFIRLLDRATGSLTLRACQGATEGLCREIKQRRKDPARDISSEVVRTGKTYFVNNMATESRFEGLWDRMDERSYILVPLKSKGSVVGTLGLVSYPGRPMSDRAVVVMEAIAHEIGIAIENALLLAESQQNEHEAITLSQLGTQVSASLALKEVLNAVAEAARKLLEADIGLVGLIDEEHQVFVLKAAAGIRSEALIGVRAPVAGLAPGSNWMSGQPVMAEINDSDQPILFDEDLIKDEKIASFLTVPLERGERILGLIQVMTRQPRRFLPRDAQLLMRLAHHVVVTIENARLYRQLRYLAVLEERDWLAREMHDHLSQTLGYMNIKTSMIDDLLVGGQVDQAREGLQELKDAAKIAYTDVREAIFNLRTSVSPGAGLLGTLQDYLVDYRMHYGLDARLIIAEEDLAELSPEVAAQLLRIIQEALVNVRKHASADKVRITCRPDGDQVDITIEDNGRGFAPDQAPGADQQHYGLQIMRERAESMGGSLVLDSQPGRGTRVIVRVPVLIQPAEGS